MSMFTALWFGCKGVIDAGFALAAFRKLAL
jgi:hypothetical protein